MFAITTLITTDASAMALLDGSLNGALIRPSTRVFTGVRIRVEVGELETSSARVGRHLLDVVMIDLLSFQVDYGEHLVRMDVGSQQWPILNGLDLLALDLFATDSFGADLDEFHDLASLLARARFFPFGDSSCSLFTTHPLELDSIW